MLLCGVWLPERLAARGRDATFSHGADQRPASDDPGRDSEAVVPRLPTAWGFRRPL